MSGNSRLELLVATRNRGKIREIQETLFSLKVKLRYLEEFGRVSTVDEVGRTYEENAVLKAVGYATQTGVCALADDSGLEVDALGGRPGVLSARFGGDHASDNQRIEKLLKAIAQYADQKRTARFVCCIALAGWEPKDHGVVRTKARLIGITEGRCEGVIATSPHGKNGFGYDPVFVPAGYEATFAELPSIVKWKISHRALALVAMRDFIKRWLA
jgi:XTP/dITP diphosphohydrolase